jgi:hypothetical protein
MAAPHVAMAALRRLFEKGIGRFAFPHRLAMVITGKRGGG